VAGKGWFPLFRFYGPDDPLFQKKWKLPDITKVKGDQSNARAANLRHSTRSEIRP
jgi:hypothetical protein